MIRSISVNQLIIIISSKQLNFLYNYETFVIELGKRMFVRLPMSVCAVCVCAVCVCVWVCIVGFLVVALVCRPAHMVITLFLSNQTKKNKISFVIIHFNLLFITIIWSNFLLRAENWHAIFVHFTRPFALRFESNAKQTEKKLFHAFPCPFPVIISEPTFQFIYIHYCEPCTELLNAKYL